MLIVGGEVVLIDSDSLPLLKGATSIHLSDSGNSRPYVRVNFGNKREYLHRLILNPGDKQSDHINRDQFDNRKINLRVVTQQENLRNQKRPNNKTGHTGVAIYSHDKSRYSAQIKHNYKKYHLGVFNTVKEALFARKVAEESLGWI